MAVASTGTFSSHIENRGMKMDFIAWIEQTEVHRWLGESPYWFPYPFIIALHAMGMGVIVGMKVAIDLNGGRQAGGAGHAPGWIAQKENRNANWVCRDVVAVPV